MVASEVPTTAHLASAYIFLTQHLCVFGPLKKLVEPIDSWAPKLKQKKKTDRVESRVQPFIAGSLIASLF